MSFRAECAIRPLPHYRRDAFVAGLEAAGYRVGGMGRIPDPKPGDVLVIWNRYGSDAMRAEAFERSGATVLVAENGYLGADSEGRQLYALAVGGHNGSGWWFQGPRNRFAALGLELKPWRKEGGHILVRGQRGIGTPLMASPADWHRTTAARLRQMQRRRVVVREHPAIAPNQPPLEQQLEGCHALVVWASSDAGKALVAGVPVFYCAPHIVVATACRRGLAQLEDPLRDEAARASAMQALAWAQWTVDELASGEPFRLLLQQQRAAE